MNTPEIAGRIREQQDSPTSSVTTASTQQYNPNGVDSSLPTNIYMQQYLLSPVAEGTENSAQTTAESEHGHLPMTPNHEVTPTKPGVTPPRPPVVAPPMPPPRSTTDTHSNPIDVGGLAPLQVPLQAKVNAKAGGFSMAMPSSPEQSPQPTGGVAALRKVRAPHLT